MSWKETFRRIASNQFKYFETYQFGQVAILKHEKVASEAYLVFKAFLWGLFWQIPCRKPIFHWTATYRDKASTWPSYKPVFLTSQTPARESSQKAQKRGYLTWYWVFKVLKREVDICGGLEVQKNCLVNKSLFSRRCCVA